MNDLFFDNKIAGLIVKFLQEDISEAELQELQAWAGTSDRAREIFDELTSEEKLPVELASYAGVRERVLTKIHAAEPETRVVVEMKRRPTWKILMAAAVMVAVTVVAYLFMRPSDDQQVVATEEVRFKNDILPGTDQATLTLADGTVIILDSSTIRGEIAKQGNVAINGTNGELKYVGEKSGVQESTQYNRVGTQKKQQFQLTLSDGTHVWLNAESSLYFPVQFSGDQRLVEITGEVYFSVAANKKMPFIVRYKNMNIEVTGTEFNVSTYENEESINTTLVEGLVKVTEGNNLLNLVPGQQAQLTKNGALKLNKMVNVEETIAWKEGRFEFSNADMRTIMRQLERWYDIDVVYETNVNNRFNATNVSRNLPISELLKLFELTEQIQFRIDGKKVVVIK